MKVFIILSLLLLTTCAKAEQSEAPVANPEEVVRKQLPQDETVDIAVAATKYQAREDLTKAEYDALRQPVPDMATFNRLVRVEDGFDNLYQFYLDTNTVAPNLNWLDIVYYDPQKESYYYGKFKPTNIEGFDDLINTKKNPAHQVYGRDRVVLITNLSPSMHIYADAYNNYQLYALELKSTIDEYGYFTSEEDDDIRFVPIWRNDLNKTIHLTWRVNTNRTFYSHITYYAVTNGIPLIENAPKITPYLDAGTEQKELLNSNKPPLKMHRITVIYSDQTKSLYNGILYDFYGDLAELTNESAPMKTNYLSSIFEGGYSGDASETAFSRGVYGAFGMN